MKRESPGFSRGECQWTDVLWDYEEEFHERGFSQAVRMGDWKGVRNAQGKPLEVYNLKDDPSETRNVAAAQPQIVAEIEAILAGARTESEYWPERGKNKPAQK